jgi:transcriptional regulator with XRE-family HTH domain
MDLKQLYTDEGPPGLRKLATRGGLSYAYLYQLATNRRSPSPAFARKLVKLDSRLDFAALLGGPETARPARAKHLPPAASNCKRGRARS